MDEKKILRSVYTVFLGVLLAIFVGVGINTFYPSEKYPEYPIELNTTYGKELTTEQQAIQKEYDQKSRDYFERQKDYSRNVSIIALVAAVALLVISILQEKRIKFIADGVMLGGLFTLLYSITRSFASENSQLIFAVVSASLAVVLYLGYRQFVRQPSAAPAKGKAAPRRKK